MTERAAIETLIRTAYEARFRSDLDGLMTFFHPQCQYHLSGTADLGPMCTPQSGCDAVRAQMAGLIDTFVFSNVAQLALIIEGNRAAYHWRADITCVPTGKTEMFEIMDLFAIEDGRIRSLTQFTDTASVARFSVA